jgi:hypothetical protein
VLFIQLIEQAASLIHAGAIQGGGGVGVEAGAGDQAEAAEQPLLVLGEVGVGQVKRGGDRQVLGVHHGQPVPRVSELGGQACGGPGGMVAQLAGEHSDCQRQVPAEPGDLPYRGVARREAGPACQPGEQRRRLVGGEDVEADHRGVRKRGEPPAAGDQHQGTGGAGQQRADLLMAHGVIQQQQNLLAGQVVPPSRRASLRAGRDLLGG